MGKEKEKTIEKTVLLVLRIRNNHDTNWFRNASKVRNMDGLAS
jgi:hypothetical protein